MSSTGKMMTAAREVIASCGTDGYLLLGFLATWVVFRVIEKGYVIEGDLHEGRFSIHPSCQVV